MFKAVGKTFNAIGSTFSLGATAIEGASYLLSEGIKATAEAFHEPTPEEKLKSKTSFLLAKADAIQQICEKFGCTPCEAVQLLNSISDEEK